MRKQLKVFIGLLAVLVIMPMLVAYQTQVKPWTKMTCTSKQDSLSFSLPYTTPTTSFHGVSYAFQCGGGATVAGDTLWIVFVVPGGDSVKIVHGLDIAASVAQTFPLQVTKFRAQYKNTGGAAGGVSVQLCGWSD